MANVDNASVDTYAYSPSQVRGKKSLVLDPQLTGPISLIADFTLFKVSVLWKDAI